MQHLLKRTAILTAVFMLFSQLEEMRCENRLEIHEKYPIKVRQIYSPHGNLRRSTHDTDQSGSQHDREALMYNDEEPNFDHPESRMSPHEIYSSKQRQPCVKCPREITAIAPEGFDGVYVDPPKPLSCKTNLPFARDLYQMETLFGPELPFVLPPGRHSLFVKIRDLDAGLIVGSCHLKYHVIVRRCKHPRLKHRKMSMFCTAGNVWGSKCAFQCKREHDILTHHESIVCNEDSQWTGQIPTCIRDIDFSIRPNYFLDNTISDVYEPESNAQIDDSCAQPEPLPNGQFKCYVENRMNAAENNRTLPTGSICKAHCNEHHSIPFGLQSMAIIECQNGIWNRTHSDIELCYHNYPIRRHIETTT